MNSSESCLSREDVEHAKKVCIDLFTEHPRQAGESYCQHFAYAAGTGLKLVGLGLVSVIHGLCPFLFTSTVSSYVPVLSRELESRKKKVSGSSFSYQPSESAFQEYTQANPVHSEEPVGPVCPVAQAVSHELNAEEDVSYSSDSSSSSDSHSHSD